MRSLTCTLLVILFFAELSLAQKPNLPDDFLPMDFHCERRETLREKMPPNSVAVLFSNPVHNRANDVNYVYHQDPNFYYLTGNRIRCF
jgi:Xaa-Pro aminopeptidase